MSTEKQTLPEALVAFKNQLLASEKACIEIVLQESEQLNLWQSKVGGMPYLPLDIPYPQQQNGEPLALLAQINCAQMPRLAGFPEQGMLQFYIGQDDVWGLDFDNQQNQNGFRVLYFEEVIEDIRQLKQDFSDIEIGDELPFSGQYAIHFEQRSQLISVEDINFNATLAVVDVDDEALELYSTLHSATGHRIGGYPYFTQSDPREYQPELKEYILLFQLDTDDSDGVDLMWGDCGVANFFIHPEDLKKRDFSKVLYNWDCC